MNNESERILLKHILDPETTLTLTSIEKRLLDLTKRQAEELEYQRYMIAYLKGEI